MTVSELAEKCGFKPEAVPEPEREITGAYAGDLLSWVMGRASSGDAWITIMSNVNILAVAALSDAACIILAEDVKPDAGVADTAVQKGINILLSEKSTYETAAALSQLL